MKFLTFILKIMFFPIYLIMIIGFKIMNDDYFEENRDRLFVKLVIFTLVMCLIEMSYIHFLPPP